MGGGESGYNNYSGAVEKETREQEEGERKSKRMRGLLAETEAKIIQNRRRCHGWHFLCSLKKVCK